MTDQLIKVAIIGADAIGRHSIIRALEKLEHEMVLIDQEDINIAGPTYPTERDALLMQNIEPAIFDECVIIPEKSGQDWRGKGKRKMRRQR